MNIIIQNIKTKQVYLSVHPLLFLIIVGVSTAIGFLLGRL